MANTFFILMVPCLLVVAETTESECSLLNIVEKMLDKMLRTELKMEQAMQTFQESEARLNLRLSSTGSTYIRWGRSSCPHSNNSLVYHGLSAGTSHSSSGGGADFQCLPAEPELDTIVTRADYINKIYGAEYQTHGATALSSLENHDVPCAVCFTNTTTTIMIPAKKTCYNGWKLEYLGFLMTESEAQPNNKQYACVDKDAEATQGSSADNTDGALFYFVFPTCGTLKCPPYNSASALACVVCSKI